MKFSAVLQSTSFDAQAILTARGIGTTQEYTPIVEFVRADAEEQEVVRDFHAILDRMAAFATRYDGTRFHAAWLARHLADACDFLQRYSDIPIERVIDATEIAALPGPQDLEAAE